MFQCLGNTTSLANMQECPKAIVKMRVEKSSEPCLVVVLRLHRKLRCESLCDGKCLES